MTTIPLDSPVNEEFLCLSCIRGIPTSPTRNNFLQDTSPFQQPRSNAMCRLRSPQNYRKQTSQTVTGKSNFMWVSRPLHRLATNFPMSIVSFFELFSSTFAWTRYRYVESCSSRLTVVLLTWRHFFYVKVTRTAAWPPLPNTLNVFLEFKTNLHKSEFEEQRHIRKIVWDNTGWSFVPETEVTLAKFVPFWTKLFHSHDWIFTWYCLFSQRYREIPHSCGISHVVLILCHRI